MKSNSWIETLSICNTSERLVEKSFEYILNREQLSTRLKFSINEPGSSNIFIDDIEDMQEKYLKEMLELKQLHVDLNEVDGNVDDSTEWLADYFQVFEFLNTFSEKLKSSLSQDGAINEDSSFRQDLENIIEKLRKKWAKLFNYCSSV